MLYFLEYKELPLAQIKPYDKNPRKNDEAVDGVAKSIQEFGFKNPMILDKNYEIICGHTRYKASQKLGLLTVPCIIADDLTTEQVKALRLADNKVAEKAEWDFDLLDAELASILNIDMSEFGFENLDAEDDKEIVEDIAPDAPTEAKSKLGDIYQLGEHILMCGDSTDSQQVLDLLGGGTGRPRSYGSTV